eukprot:364437-Chlamydomonas_euryale.AAC.1
MHKRGKGPLGRKTVAEREDGDHTRDTQLGSGKGRAEETLHGAMFSAVLSTMLGTPPFLECVPFRRARPHLVEHLQRRGRRGGGGCGGAAEGGAVESDGACVEGAARASHQRTRLGELAATAGCP